MKTFTRFPGVHESDVNSFTGLNRLCWVGEPEVRERPNVVDLTLSVCVSRLRGPVLSSSRLALNGPRARGPPSLRSDSTPRVPDPHVSGQGRLGWAPRAPGLGPC